jgi:predicted kinase
MAKNNTRTLYIVRGLPGSGKSTLAALLTDHRYSVDDDAGPGHRSSEYMRALGDECYGRVQEAMERGHDVVSVDNCFVSYRSMDRYKDLAWTYGYRVSVVAMQNEFGSVHDVPPAAQKGMEESWEW